MKAEERHHLKQNEFAVTAAKVATTMAANRSRIMVGSIAIVVILALVGGYFYWNKRTNDQASGMLGRAMAIAQSQIVPAPTLPGATQPAGTYPTEQARDQAAVKAFRRCPRPTLDAVGRGGAVSRGDQPDGASAAPLRRNRGSGRVNHQRRRLDLRVDGEKWDW